MWLSFTFSITYVYLLSVGITHEKWGTIAGSCSYSETLTIAHVDHSTVDLTSVGNWLSRCYRQQYSITKICTHIVWYYALQHINLPLTWSQDVFVSPHSAVKWTGRHFRETVSTFLHDAKASRLLDYCSLYWQRDCSGSKLSLVSL